MKKEIIEQEETHNIELLNNEEVDRHSFKLNVNDGEFFDNDYVLKVQLPKFGLIKHGEDQQILNDSSIIITCQHGPNVAKNLLLATHRKFDNFSIEFLLNDKIYCTWSLYDAYICGVSFGELSKIGHQNEADSFIDCEVLFKTLEIDGIKV
jgi:hypothetical protein